jgi:hypothetical protein
MLNFYAFIQNKFYYNLHLIKQNLIKILRTRHELLNLSMNLLRTHALIINAPNDNVTQNIYFRGQHNHRLSKLCSLLSLLRTSPRHTVWLKRKKTVATGSKRHEPYRTMKNLHCSAKET